jgi:hypothetical protein
MPSPFPGMDPFLEAADLWPAFHHQFVAGLYQLLLPGLVDRYRARVSQRVYVTEVALFTSVVRDQHVEELIEIRQRGDGRLVTMIDAVSPANKMTPEGRQAYLARRAEAKSGGANLVEVDLVLQGEPLLDYSRDGLPAWNYAVTVTRAAQPERYEIYTATLQKRLPRFRLPLASDDRDTVLDLQSAFARCFDQGGFAARIDYHQDPAGTLTDEDRTWLDELLRQAKVR